MNGRYCTCRWLKRWPDGTVQWDLRTEGSEFIKCAKCRTKRTKRTKRTLNTPQPAPTNDDAGPEVWPALLAEVAMSPELRALCMERDATGRAKYGTALRVHNGRAPLVDALQEALGLAVYLHQALMRVGGAAGVEPLARMRAVRLMDMRDDALGLAELLCNDVTP